MNLPSTSLAIIESRLALKSEKGQLNGDQIFIKFISSMFRGLLLVISVPPGHMTCERVLSFKKLSTVNACLGLGWQVGFNVGKHVIFSFSNLATGNAPKKLLPFLKHFCHKTFWFSFVQPWNGTYLNTI